MYILYIICLFNANQYYFPFQMAQALVTIVMQLVQQYQSLKSDAEDLNKVKKVRKITNKIIWVLFRQCLCFCVNEKKMCIKLKSICFIFRK